VLTSSALEGVFRSQKVIIIVRHFSTHLMSDFAISKILNVFRIRILVNVLTGRPFTERFWVQNRLAQIVDKHKKIT
jgi:hypothetical protein